MLIAVELGGVWAQNVDFPVIRRYPPGYYGSGYYAQSFFQPTPPKAGPKDPFKWDRYMSRELGIEFPFYPIPFEWDYGNGLCFNFPDFNANDWP